MRFERRGRVGVTRIGFFSNRRRILDYCAVGRFSAWSCSLFNKRALTRKCRKSQRPFEMGGEKTFLGSSERDGGLERPGRPKRSKNKEYKRSKNKEYKRRPINFGNRVNSGSMPVGSAIPQSVTKYSLRRRIGATTSITGFRLIVLLVRMKLS